MLWPFNKPPSRSTVNSQMRKGNPGRKSYEHSFPSSFCERAVTVIISSLPLDKFIMIHVCISTKDTYQSARSLQDEGPPSEHKAVFLSTNRSFWWERFFFLSTAAVVDDKNLHLYVLCCAPLAANRRMIAIHKHTKSRSLKSSTRTCHSLRLTADKIMKAIVVFLSSALIASGLVSGRFR